MFRQLRDLPALLVDRDVDVVAGAAVALDTQRATELFQLLMDTLKSSESKLSRVEFAEATSVVVPRLPLAMRGAAWKSLMEVWEIEDQKANALLREAVSSLAPRLSPEQRVQAWNDVVTALGTPVDSKMPIDERPNRRDKLSYSAQLLANGFSATMAVKAWPDVRKLIAEKPDRHLVQAAHVIAGAMPREERAKAWPTIFRDVRERGPNSQDLAGAATALLNGLLTRQTARTGRTWSKVSRQRLTPMNSNYTRA